MFRMIWMIYLYIVIITFFTSESPKCKRAEHANKKWQQHCGEAPAVASGAAEILIDGIQVSRRPSYVYERGRGWGRAILCGCFLGWWLRRRWNRRWRRGGVDGAAARTALFFSAVCGGQRGLIKFPWFNGVEWRNERNKEQIDEDQYWYLNLMPFDQHGGFHYKDVVFVCVRLWTGRREI